MQLTNQEQIQETENVELLTMMMGDAVDSEVARRVLRKHKGDMEKAADAILSGDRGEDTDWTPPHGQPVQDVHYNTPKIPQATPAPASSVIDLTSDDDEYSRALKMSMETSQPEPKFGPSERAPDPAWQMVPSNVQVNTGALNEDQTLNDAIQASLNDFAFEESHSLPWTDTVREGGRPVALRPEVPSLAYAALVLQALYFVPQVRAAVASLHLPDIDVNLPRASPARAIWNLIELFANMDLAHLSAIVDAEVLPSLRADPLKDTESVVIISQDFVRTIGVLVEGHINEQKESEDAPDSRLFSFTHGHVVLNDRMPRTTRRDQAIGNVVTVEFSSEGTPNDLVSCLAATLSRFHENGSAHDVIFDTAEFVGFQLKRMPNKTKTKTSLDLFVYPKTVCLDQFLFHNLELANNKRAHERELLAGISNLRFQKETLTRHNDRDTLKDLRAAIDYYDHVADAKGDADRNETINHMKGSLRNILEAISAKVQDIERRIEQLETDLSTVFDCPELQKYRYDLRAVLMHTGLPGRKQIYSYVQDYHGIWWKTVDHIVTEVPEETVLTDPTGLHLDAGPYLVLYSRHLPKEELQKPVQWPQVFTDPIEAHNKTFLEAFSQELPADESKHPRDDPMASDAWHPDHGTGSGGFM